jgi:hypothetical protein
MERKGSTKVLGYPAPMTVKTSIQAARHALPLCRASWSTCLTPRLVGRSRIVHLTEPLGLPQTCMDDCEHRRPVPGFMCIVPRSAGFDEGDVASRNVPLAQTYML